MTDATTKREAVRDVFEGRRPPYVPWHVQFTKGPRDLLIDHFGGEDAFEAAVDNHILELGSAIGFFEELGNERFRDVFGVEWDRRIDKDIGNVDNRLLPEPTLKDFTLPDPQDPRFFEPIERDIARFPDRYRVFYLGFSLFERAWTLRGMPELLMDFIEHPHFVRELLDAIADYDIAQVRKALEYDIDAVYFGDDWGQQQGLIMGRRYWTEFIRPPYERMVRFVRDAGKRVMIHSCGDVDELFDDLIEMGVNVFNPFQPEVMDVFDLLKRYRGRLAFHGGLSIQRTLPRGTVEEVRAATRRLLEAGREGGYIFAPSHAVERDTPLSNLLAFIETMKDQEGVGIK